MLRLEQRKKKHAVAKEQVFQSFMSTARISPKATLSKGPIERGPDAMMKIDVDLNNDGIVDSADLGMQLGATGGKDMSYDHNHDGMVDSRDVDLLLGFWGTEGNTGMRNPDLDGNGSVDSSDLGMMIANFGSDEAAYDLNNDGVNDQSDLDILLASWGKSRIT